MVLRSRNDHFQDATISGKLSMGTDAAVEGNLLPDTTDLRTLGDATHKWAAMHITETVTGETLTDLPSDISNVPSLTDGSFVGKVVEAGHAAFGAIGQASAANQGAVGGWLFGVATGTGDGTGLQAEGYETPGVGQTVTQGGAGVFAFHANRGVGTTNVSAAFRGLAGNISTGTIARAISFWGQAATNIGGGTVTDAYSFYASAQTVGGSNYGVYIEDLGSAAADFAIYSVGGKNRFVGPTQCGLGATEGEIYLNDGTSVAGTFLGPQIMAGNGSPEGAFTGRVGSLFMRADGGAGTSLYVKESGTGNTGWVAK